MYNKKTTVFLVFIISMMLLLASCTSKNSSYVKKSSIYIIDTNDPENGSGSEQIIKWTDDISKYNSSENDSLRLISHTRSTGVMFEERQKFSFSFGDVKRDFEYCSDDSGERSEIVFHDANGSLCTLSVNKNGDFIRFINGNKQLDDELFLSESELHNKAMSYLKLYNKNLLTGDRIVDPNDYIITLHQIIDGSYYLWMTQKEINGWYSDAHIIIFIQHDGTLDKIQITKPGYIYGSEVPEMPEIVWLESQLCNMLMNYSSGYDSIEIDHYRDEYGRCSPVLRYDEYGRLGAEIRVLFLNEGKYIYSTSVYVPFESLDLNNSTRN